MKKIIKEILKGIALVLTIIFSLYFVFVFLFYDLVMQCDLLLDGAKLRALQIQLTADMKARQFLMDRELEGRQMLLRSRGECLSSIQNGKNNEFFHSLIFQSACAQSFKKARSVYDENMRKAKEEADRIRVSAKKEAMQIIRETTENANPLKLLLSGFINKRPLKGYMYDPLKGKLEPVFDAKLPRLKNDSN